MPLLQSRSPTAQAVTLSVNPRQRRGHTHCHHCVADAPPLAHSGNASTAAPPCGAYLPLHSIPGRGPGLTENGSALRTSSSTLTTVSPVVAHHPHITALIVAERRHSAITRYAERSAACRDSTRPCCRRAGGTPLLQSRSPTARAVSSSVNPRQRRGHTHRRTCAADAPPLTRQGQPSIQKKSPSRGWRIQKYKCGLDYLTITLVAVPLARTT